MRKIFYYVKRLFRRPRHLIGSFQFHFCPPTLLRSNLREEPKYLYHLAAFTPHNAGDALQTILVRDIFKYHSISAKWKLRHVHTSVDKSAVKSFNRKDAILIGSGGLILPTFEEASGWQWNCSIETLKNIQTPIIGFGLGFNCFRGHKIESPIFVDHLNHVIGNSIFWGMRNRGSVRALKRIISNENFRKVSFQPCITTIISRIYPQLLSRVRKRNVVAVNCAFDRREMRFGKRGEEILNDIAMALKKLSQNYEIHYFLNSESDSLMLPYLDQGNVDYKVVKLYDVPVEKIIHSYTYPKLVIGMRGHAQLIPFGCGTPILSLISHEKLRWFLEDIDASEWGIELQDQDLRNSLISKASIIIEDAAVEVKIKKEMDNLYAITKKNMLLISDRLKGGSRCDLLQGADTPR